MFAQQLLLTYILESKAIAIGFLYLYAIVFNLFSKTVIEREHSAILLPIHTVYFIL